MKRSTQETRPGRPSVAVLTLALALCVWTPGLRADEAAVETSPAVPSPAVPSPAVPSPAVAIVGGTVYPVATPPIEDGVILVRQGRVVAVGPRAEVEIPGDATRVDASGLSVIPGLVDVSSGCLQPEGAYPPKLSKAESCALDDIDPFDPVFGLLRREGITTIGVAPFARGPLRGVGSVIKLRRPLADAAGELAVLELGAYLQVELGVVAPNFAGGRTSTAERLGQFYALRGLLASAQRYREAQDKYWKAVKKFNRELEAWKKAQAGAKDSKKASDGETSEKSDKKKASDEKKDDAPADEKKPEKGGFERSIVLDAIERGALAALEEGSKPEAKKPDGEHAPRSAPKKPAPKKPTAPTRPKLDAGKEVLVKALTGRLPVFVTAHRRDDIGFALQLAREFGLSMTVVGASEGHERARALAKTQTGAVVGPVLHAEIDVRHGERRESNCAALAAAGVPVAIGGAGGAGLESRYLRLHAAVAVRGGLSPELALRAVTLEPARLAGIDDRVGSIEPGKDADFVLLDGDPLHATSAVRRVIIDGETVYPIQRRF